MASYVSSPFTGWLNPLTFRQCWETLSRRSLALPLSLLQLLKALRPSQPSILAMKSTRLHFSMLVGPALQPNHLLTYLQSTGGFYNFSNIRYAEPPVGDLRFRAPVPVTTQSNTVQNGSLGAICPQANPAWLAITTTFIPAYLTGMNFSYEAAVAALANSSAPPPAMDPRTSEDCLFLDVVVPKQIFDQAGNQSCGGAPVMVWIYGGGYTFGSKSGSGNPAGLIKASLASGSTGIIYVSMNYRVRCQPGSTQHNTLLTAFSWERSDGSPGRLCSRMVQPMQACTINV